VEEVVLVRSSSMAGCTCAINADVEKCGNGEIDGVFVVSRRGLAEGQPGFPIIWAGAYREFKAAEYVNRDVKNVQLREERSPR
jgi:hypothetical protein